jgi:hypothetical protein
VWHSIGEAPWHQSGLGDYPEEIGSTSESRKASCAIRKAPATVVKRFVESFDHPDSAETKEFWQTIAHRYNGGSGPSYLSGWITAFCFWDNHGNCLFDNTSRNYFRLDGVLYHRVDIEDIPKENVSVPVMVNDQGFYYDAHMIAGSVAIKISDSSKTAEFQDGPKWMEEFIKQLASTQTSFTGMDTLQPVSGWWMFKIKNTAGQWR